VITILLCIGINLLREAVAHLRMLTIQGNSFQRDERRERRPSRTTEGVAGGGDVLSTLGGAPKPSDRELRRSVEKFQECFLGEDDVDVERFMAACRHFGDKVLQPMGSFTLLTVREIHANMDKIKHTYQLDPGKHRSLRSLLEAEVEERMHKPGPEPTCELQDPSAAMGVMWARRGLVFWEALFRPHCLAGEDLRTPDSRPRTPTSDDMVGTGSSGAMAAYEEALAPFNGWVTRNTFMLATRAFPGWTTIQGTFAPTLKDQRDDVRAWNETLSPLLEQIFAIIRELQLHDLRKSI